MSYIEIVMLQGLNKRFYKSYIPIALSNLNQTGGVGLGR